MKIAISIGHGRSKNGGYDSGAVGGNYHEFRLSREIGKYLKAELSKYNCTVELINYDGNMYLYDRIQYIKKRAFDLALELHMNAFNKKANGSECYHKFKSESGKLLAGKISKSISQKLGAKNRGSKIKTYSDSGREKDYFGFVREIPCESLLIETLFIDNTADREKLITGSGQKVCAKAIADAIVDFYNLSAKEEPDFPDTVSPDFKKGDSVKIKGNYYATGEKIPLWVKRKVHILKDDPALMPNKRYRALLSSINSYVYTDDLERIKNDIKVGDKVTIKDGAIYGGLSSSRGNKVPQSELKPKVHTVSKLQNNMGADEALLKDINSWVSLNFLSEVR